MAVLQVLEGLQQCIHALLACQQVMFHPPCYQPVTCAIRLVTHCATILSPSA